RFVEWVERERFLYEGFHAVSSSREHPPRSRGEPHSASASLTVQSSLCLSGVVAARRRLAEAILLAVLGLVAGRHPAVARRRKPTVTWLGIQQDPTGTLTGGG